jgi:WD40 repeat protein
LSGDGYASRLLEALLDALRPALDQPPRWDLAEPYLLRHAIQHAVDAGRADELLADPEFLVYAKADTLLPELPSALTPTALLNTMVYRASAGRHQDADPDTRRQLLALDATRFRFPQLAGSLTAPAGASTPMAWTPRWSTGSQVTPALAATLTGHTKLIEAVAVGDLDGRPIAVSGSWYHTVRVWDLRNHQPLGPLIGPRLEGRSIEAVAVGDLDGRPIVVTGESNGAVQVWDLRTGEPLGPPFTGQTSVLGGMAVGDLDGRPIAVTCGWDDTVSVCDLRSGRPLYLPLTGHTSAVRDVAVGDLDGRPIAVTCSNDETVRVWDLRAHQPIGPPLTGHRDWVIAVAVGKLDGRPVAVSGGVRGSVWVWDLRSGRPLGPPLPGHAGSVDTIAVGDLDGRPVAVTGGSDKTVGAWDLRSKQPLAVMPTPTHVYALALAPGAELVIGFGWEVAVLRWSGSIGHRQPPRDPQQRSGMTSNPADENDERQP